MGLMYFLLANFAHAIMKLVMIKVQFYLLWLWLHNIYLNNDNAPTQTDSKKKFA